jgi:ABC-type polysaccharide/polyol phosphate export permease
MTPDNNPLRPKGRSSAVYVYRAGSSTWSRLLDALNDLALAGRMWRTWTKLAWWDYRQQNGRNVLGPLWSIAGLALTVGVLGYVYGALLSYDPRHGYPFVAAGMIAWFFISSCVGGGPFVFLNAAGLIKERPLPISFSVFQYTFRIFIEFCSKFLVFALVALLTLFAPTVQIALLIPGLLLYLLNGLWVTMLFGIAGARYRDISQIIGPLMLIIFLATPILWPADMLSTNSFIARLNPFTHYIDIIREPLLGNVPSMISYVMVTVIAAAGWIVTLLAFARNKDRIVFWL